MYTKLSYRLANGVETTSYNEALESGFAFETVFTPVMDKWEPDEKFKEIVKKRFPVLAD